nr:hypothetical protein [Fusobacterium gastrosuis]
MFKIKKFIVKPLSSKKENFYLLLVFCILIFSATLALKFRYKEKYKQNILSNQISAFSSLNNIEASVYSDILNSVLEINLLYDETEQFPSIATLEEREIPPYYKDQSWEQKGALKWNRFEHENEIYYLGLSTVSEIGSFLLSIDKNSSENASVFYTKENLPEINNIEKLENYQNLFKKIVPYTGGDERKKFKEE